MQQILLEKNVIQNLKTKYNLPTRNTIRKRETKQLIYKNLGEEFISPATKKKRKNCFVYKFPTKIRFWN